MPLMVRTSVLLVPLTAKVTVRVVDPITMLSLPLTISLLFAAATFPTPALNRHPLGAVSINVLLAPLELAKSPFDCSVMTMLPSVVYACAAPFAARSAERFVPPAPGAPPEPFVTETLSVKNNSACKPDVCPSAVALRNAPASS
jgi:hypothetical protein